MNWLEKKGMLVMNSKLLVVAMPLLASVFPSAAFAESYDLPKGSSDTINTAVSYEKMSIGGDLTVNGGVTVATSETVLGGNADESATIAISGKDTLFDSTKMTVGGAAGGTGRITTSDGGVIRIGWTNGDANRLEVAAGAVPASGDAIDVLALGTGKHAVARLANLSAYPARILFANGAQLSLETSASSQWTTSFGSGNWVLESDESAEIKISCPPNHYFTGSSALVRTAGSGLFHVVRAPTVYDARMTFANTGGFTLDAGAVFVFVAGKVDMSAMRGQMTVNGMLTVKNNPVYADGLVIGSAGGISTSSTQPFTFGSGDRDGLFSAALPASNRVVKVGSGTLTVTGSSTAGRMIVSNGTLKVTAPLAVDTLELEDGTTLIVEGVELSVNHMVKHGSPTVSVRGAGRLVLPVVAADADTWLSKPADTEDLVFLKTGSHDSIVYDPADVRSIDVREGAMRFSAYGRTEKYLRILFSKMSTKKTAAVVKPLTMGKVAIFGADGTIPSDGTKNTTDGKAADQLAEKTFAYTAAITKISTSDWWLVTPNNVFIIDQGMNNYCLLASPNIDPDDPLTRFGYVIRLPAASVNISGYDFSVSSSRDYPTDWTVEASATGADGTWTLVDARTDQMPVKHSDLWWSGGGKNNPTQTFEFPGTYLAPGVTGLADELAVRVDGGATADFSMKAGGQSVKTLTVDAAKGCGTLVNAKIAANGALNVINAETASYKGVFPLALALTDAADVDNFKSWTVSVNGVPQKCTVAWENGQLVACPPGLVLLFR